MEANVTALLVMDMQMGILTRMPKHGEATLNKVIDAIKIARENNVTVIFIRLAFQNGLPEVSDANVMFSAAKQFMSIGDNLKEYIQLHPALGVKGNDIIVNKKRISAFAGSDLEMILRANSISKLVLAGIATSGVVLSTFREALDKDYSLTVLSNACADRDEEAHIFLTEKLFPKHAEVTTVEGWQGVLNSI